MSSTPQRRTLTALAAAAAFHGAVLLLWTSASSDIESPQTRSVAQEPPSSQATAPLALIDLVDWPAESGEPLEASLGQSDRFALVAGGQGNVESAGLTSGAASEGAPGQSASFDRRDPSLHNAALWNDARRDHQLRTGDRGIAASGESIRRSQQKNFDGHEGRVVRARSGVAQPLPGVAEAAGQGGMPGDEGKQWLGVDPLFDEAPAAQKKARLGDARPNRGRALSEIGERASDHKRRGRVADRFRASSSSSSLDPSVYDQGASSHGGKKGLGAGGHSGHALAGESGRGQAVDRGDQVGATYARRSDPYFRELYQRIDKEINFPRDLALRLEQGEVILRFRISAAGKLSGLSVQKSSGYAAFDKEAKRAFLRAAPFGRPPEALLAGRDQLLVSAPYFFRNPLIR